MNKMPIAWHKERLASHFQYLQRERDMMKEKFRLIEQSESELQFLQAQIIAAERQGKDGFDADKFLKPKSTKPKT